MNCAWLQFIPSQLLVDNKGDPNPRWLAHFWYGSHPDGVARIQAAEQWAR